MVNLNKIQQGEKYKVLTLRTDTPVYGHSLVWLLPLTLLV